METTMMRSVTRMDFIKLAAIAALTRAAPAIASSEASNAGPLMMRPIPKTGEKLIVVGLGTAHVFANRGNAETVAASREVFKTLLAAGASVVDTASTYEDSEALVGELVASLGARPKAFLATKLEELGRDGSARSMEESFKNLRTDKIDLMQVHNVRDAGQLSLLRDWKAQGRFRYIGITHSSPRRQEAMADIMAKEDFDFIQFNYSVDVREPEKRLLPMAKDRGVAVIVNVPFGTGALLQAKRGQLVPNWLQEDLGCQSWAQVLLKFVLSHPATTVAIPATNKAEHMADNLNGARGRLPDAGQRERIAALWS